MKTETYPEEANLTVGQILRQAREKNELSQQIVADRLCLKLSTVRDIEEDTIPSNITPTFLRGYIRSYAKLVQIPESDILSMLDKQMPTKTVKVSPMQSFSSGKKRKKRDGWLMKITWVVIIILLGMTILWWWQNYKAQQKELTSMAEQSSAQVQSGEHDLGTSTTAVNNLSVPPEGNQPVESAQENMPAEQTSTGANESDSAVSSSSVPSSSVTEPKTVPLPANQSVAKTASENPAGIAVASTANSAVSTSSVDVNNINTVSNNELVMNFSGRCWLEIKNARGKILFSGTKSKGDSLRFSDESSYSLNIGAPVQVMVQFRGKPVDLSTFINKGTAAKLTLK
ncbi:cytoskeleton protein RodZ [Xenorhabdus nematophila]|uniref:HTH-type transcriptional regulator yfgA n=1 Tax=Xenorhabdus nematophila (strain ATCC 19061 / DSM 3370 / CCUG 14189 / LMG 1036 / NCIMB 9965 / AN6) TaxID=406817 RepID=D3VLP1_XENNA|nr:cytoskeleton protein RodZ [Xenorhabdus nematophila]CEE90475.1 putative HTH-type transcriptional regulator yfgA [Xenorhabdus nematophila str. Anatoliense]CEF32851.1 putative HTH-type transcriptional regulator yfgA [Xenorhabdus nematophila str. Websteri]AYA39475.1 cytoskeleton protein RodZ [Xenorhabdus nematophila]KHD28457.1 cytoskeletal protein RodZ [Xenorhabdus nematophila]MBA0018042.1 cytoskeleton protein RodZ [Xenorhabdus nematophila]